MSDEQNPKLPPPPWERGREESSANTPGQQPPPLQTGSGGTGGTPPPRSPGGPGEPPPPYQPPTAAGFGGGDLHADAARRVKAPAITMLILAILALGFQLFGLVFSIISASIGKQPFPAELAEPLEEFYGPEMTETFVNIYESSQSIVYTLAMFLFVAAVLSIIIYGSLKMKNLESWGFSMGAVICSMLPCGFPCCCLQLPIGIWALIVLLDEDVKEAFYS